jgi:hypothetical protein
VDELNAQLNFGSITLDGWVSKATESFLGVTCHYVDLDFYLRNLVLTLRYLDDKHTTQFIHDNIKQVLSDWKLDDKVRNPKNKTKTLLLF